MKITNDVDYLWLIMLDEKEFPEDFRTNEEWRFSTCEKEDFIKLQSICKYAPTEHFKNYVDSVSKRFDEGHYISPTDLLKGAFEVYLGAAEFKGIIQTKIYECFSKEYDPIYLSEKLIEQILNYRNSIKEMKRQKERIDRIKTEIDDGDQPHKIMECILNETTIQEPDWWDV